MYDLACIASEWHGGQWTEMYKYMSSGYIEDIDCLIAEVQQCIDSVHKFPKDEWENLNDGLQEFSRVLKEREDLRWNLERNCLMAPWCKSYSEGCRAIIPQNFIQTVADTIENLHEREVVRVLEQFGTYGEMIQMSRWLIEQREDLRPATDALVELLSESYELGLDMVN
jgi:hypothetical protein